MTRLAFPYVYVDYLHKISIEIFVVHIFDTNILQECQSFHTKNKSLLSRKYHRELNHLLSFVNH